MLQLLGIYCATHSNRPSSLPSNEVFDTKRKLETSRATGGASPTAAADTPLPGSPAFGRRACRGGGLEGPALQVQPRAPWGCLAARDDPSASQELAFWEGLCPAMPARRQDRLDLELVVSNAWG